MRDRPPGRRCQATPLPRPPTGGPRGRSPGEVAGEPHPIRGFSTIAAGSSRLASRAAHTNERGSAMRTIVIGYDETEPSKRALERAVSLAKAFDAKLVVTSVAPILQSAGGRGAGPIETVD